ncbi:uncharacterized protein LOC141685437 [Apium graveolens]|uniref:uncharacterized protein LOC141685437 n=1 Tax=Apium graveolens TaxID=4045 RepID=UPI003D79DC0E
MLDGNNKLSEGFCYAHDRLNIPDTDDFSLILVSSKSASGRKNQVGPSNEVAALIIGDSDNTCPFRDIVVETKQKFLKRVYETCKHFMSLRYPLLFPYGDDRFHLNIPLKNKKQNVPAEAVNDQHPDVTRYRTTVTMREYYAYKLMIRPDEGSQRYMNQYFKDSLAICRTIGHPSLFLTMTCNTQLPKIKQMMEYLPGVDVANKPDVIARVFKLKLDQLLDLIKNKNYFGKCIGVMHVIEFQKRGLPHCHMLIWLHPQSRPQNVQQIDQLISAEIPDKNMDPIGYNIVPAHMIHESCGKDFSYSSCMVQEKCGCHFSKKYNADTFFDDCGFPVYRRRQTEASVLKKGVFLDNQKKNKKDTPDEMTTKVKSTDEIKNFLDGRYICSSEAAWRLLGFDIHHRFPSVERLLVHMEDEKSVHLSHTMILEMLLKEPKFDFPNLKAGLKQIKLFQRQDNTLILNFQHILLNRQTYVSGSHDNVVRCLVDY